MNAIKILKDIKGKLLDAHHFDLLQHAYELKNKDIQKLEENNSILKEKHDRQTDQIEKLSAENKDLVSRVSDLEARLKSAGARHDDVMLSEAAQAVIQQCTLDNVIEFIGGDMILSLAGKFSRIEIEAAFDELEAACLIMQASNIPMVGTEYVFTEKGKQYILRIARQQQGL